MRDYNLPIRRAIVTSLQGNVLIDGEAVPVFANYVSPDSTFPYIYIPSQNTTNDSGKAEFSAEQSVNIEAVVRSVDGGNSDELDMICDQVKQIIDPLNPQNRPEMEWGTWGMIRFENDIQLTDYDEVYIISRKVMTFTVKVSEPLEAI